MPGPAVADCGTVFNELAAATGAESRYLFPGGKTGELEPLKAPPIVVIVGLAVGSATVLRLTTLEEAPPLLGESPVSAPEPTWIDRATPPAPVAPAAKLGTPVMLPGFKLEIPPVPVI